MDNPEKLATLGTQDTPDEDYTNQQATQNNTEN